MQDSHLITQQAINQLRTELDTLQQNLLNSQTDIAAIQTYAENRLAEIEQELLDGLARVEADLIAQIIQAAQQIIANIPTPDHIAPPSTVPVGTVCMYAGDSSVFANGGMGVTTGLFKEWAICNGSTQSFSDGSTFVTPNFLNRFVVGGSKTASSGAWVADIDGDSTPRNFGGSSTKVLIVDNLPSHTHTMDFRLWNADGNDPLPPEQDLYGVIEPNYPNNTTKTSGATGSALPFNIIPPYLAVAYIVKVRETYSGGTSGTSGTGTGTGTGTGSTTVITNNITLNNPVGGIMMYGGSGDNFDATGLGSGPTLHWALCNGNNGTVDLRDRFIVGARTYAAPQWRTSITGAPTQTGGEAVHTLTVPELPSHTHSYLNQVGYQETDPDLLYNGTEGVNGYVVQPISTLTGHVTHPPFTATGGNSPHNNLPPYYALAYIQYVG